MSIYFGNDTINGLYIGLTPVSKGYVGTHLFYNGDDTIVDLTYEKYILNTQYNTLYNTEEAPIKSAILKGNTGYRDIDTGEFLETFEEGRNLELVSVKMPVLTTTGKNLYRVGVDDYADNSQISSDGELITTSGRTATRNFIPLKPNTTYKLSSNCSASLLMAIYGYTEAEESTFTRMILNPHLNKKPTFTTNSSENFVRFRYNAPKDKILTFDIQVEEGSTETPYEPPKSNILTVNEDVTLRSNGDVYDELNLLTGRLTQRIDENNEVLSQEVVKTVDLSVVNQDGNNTNLSTFNDITHVTLSSEGFIPEVELEVATKNEEVLNTMSLEMDDISTTQNDLQETSNTQSENVDATMMATTEIYEQLL